MLNVGSGSLCVTVLVAVVVTVLLAVVVTVVVEVTVRVVSTLESKEVLSELVAVGMSLSLSVIDGTGMRVSLPLSVPATIGVKVSLPASVSVMIWRMCGWWTWWYGAGLKRAKIARVATGLGPLALSEKVSSPLRLSPPSSVADGLAALDESVGATLAESVDGVALDESGEVSVAVVESVCVGCGMMIVALPMVMLAVTG